MAWLYVNGVIMFWLSQKNSKCIVLFSMCVLFVFNLSSRSFFNRLTRFNKRNVQAVKQIFDNFYEVDRGKLYRSKQLKASQLNSYIKRYNIKTIINLRGSNSGQSWWEDEKCVAKENNVKHVDIAMQASSLPKRDHICQLIELFEDKSNYPIYVHCQGGADRTGLATAVYKLLKGSSKKNAKRELRPIYGHLPNRLTGGNVSAMDKFIDMWQGRDWAFNVYSKE